RLVRAVVQREFWNEQTRPILLLANTHRACDELVRKLHDQWPDLRPYLVRLGPANAGMEPLVRQYVLAERLRVREQLDGVDLRANGAAAFVRLVRQGVLLHDQAAVFVGTLAGAARRSATWWWTSAARPPSRRRCRRCATCRAATRAASSWWATTSSSRPWR